MLREKLKISLNYHQLTIPLDDEIYYKLISEETINKFIRYIEEVGEENVIELSCCKDIEEFHKEKLKCFKTWKEFYNNIHNVYQSNISILYYSRKKYSNLSKNIQPIINIVQGPTFNKEDIMFIQNELFRKDEDDSNTSTMVYLDILTYNNTFDVIRIIEWVSNFNVEKIKFINNNIICKTLLTKPAYRDLNLVINNLNSIILAKKMETGDLWKYVIHMVLQQNVSTSYQALLETFKLYYKIYHLEMDRCQTDISDLQDDNCFNYIRLNYQVYKLLIKNSKAIDECSKKVSENEIIKSGYKYAVNIFNMEKMDHKIKENITLENWVKNESNLHLFTRNFVTGCFKAWSETDKVINNYRNRKELFESFSNIYRTIEDRALQIAARD